MYSLKQINEAIRSDPAAFAQECDEQFAKKVDTAARKIADHRGESHIILLSGPSGSGKTTRRPSPGTGREPLTMSPPSAWMWTC